MANKVKEGDFIELEYTGIVKDDNLVFDTTNEELAKKENLFNPDMSYGPVIICVGQGQILKGLEKEIEAKETGKEYSIELAQEQGFGRKNPKLLQLIQTNKFTKQGIQPMPGLQVNIDGIIGIVKIVTGGRTIVDFNHPLAGKSLVYKVKINRIVEDSKEKVQAYAMLAFNLKKQDLEINMADSKASISIKKKLDIPEKIKKETKDKIAELIPSVKEVEFKQ